MWTFTINSVEQMQNFAALLGEQSPCVIAIDGDLGAGKTVFAQGLGRGLGITELIVSPTFIIVNEYESEIPLLHIDLYRLSEPDLFHLGLEETIEDWNGFVVIEWASLHPQVLPLDHLKIQIKIEGDIRHVTVNPHGEMAESIIKKWYMEWNQISVS
jgi:tRNA threonylcarbamoyladenosine biosynthesis protein TsaE